MSAKRFSAPGKVAPLALRAAKHPGVIIVLLAIALVGSGCASVRPPAPKTVDAVNAEVVETPDTKESQGHEMPKGARIALGVVGVVLRVAFAIAFRGPL